MILSALCDSDCEKRETLKSLYPDVPIFESYEMLLESGICDAIIISTPHYYHPTIAIAAFKAGLNVLSEKPAGVYTSAVRKMIDAAEESKKTFAIMFNQRTTPIYEKAREIVKSGQLGELKRLVWIITNWYRTQNYYDSGIWRATWKGEGGGVLINQAPHNLDLWQWIFGMPKSVRAFCTVGKYHNITVEDDATIYAEYENGATATFITSTGEYPGTNRLEISGDLGKIVIENGKLIFSQLSMPERTYCFDKDAEAPPEINLSVFEDNSEESGHIKILQNFADAVLHGRQLISPGKEGLNELLISNAAYLSSWRNCRIEIPFNETDFEVELLKRANTEIFDKEPSCCDRDETGNYRERWGVNW